MSDDLAMAIRELRIEIGKLQSLTAAMQQSMADLAIQIAPLDLMITSYGARIAALEAAQRANITTADIEKAMNG